MLKNTLIEISQDIAKLTHVYQQHHKSEFSYSLTGNLNQERIDEMKFIQTLHEKPQEYLNELFIKLENKSVLIAELEADKQAIYIQNFIYEVKLGKDLWEKLNQDQLQEASFIQSNSTSLKM